MNIFGEIADSILIGAACLSADIECAVSSIGLGRIGKKMSKPTAKQPTNPTPPKAAATNPTVGQPTNPTPPKEENPTPPPKAEVTNPSASQPTNPTPPKAENPPKPKVEVVHNNAQGSSGGEDIVADAPIAAAMASNPVFSYDPRYGNRPTLDLRCNIDYGASNPPSPPNNIFSQNATAGAPNDQHSNPRTQMTSDAIIPDMSQNICYEQPTIVSGTQPVQQSVPQQVQRVYSVPQQVYTPYVQSTIPFSNQNGSQQYQHKVDEPPKQKPVILPKDDTQISNLDDHTKGVINNIATVAPDPEKKTVDVVMPGAIEKGERPVEKTGPNPVKSRVDNREMIRRYPVLKEIESISLDSGYQIGFFDHVTCPDIVCCLIAGENGIPIEGKGFMIDINGNVIDRRKKIFPVLSKYVENQNAYHLYAKSDNDKKGKGKKAEKDKLNVDLIRDLIIGGPAAVKRRPMYDSSIVDLNMYVDLSTTPRQNISNEDRDYIHSTLIRLRDKVFADIFRNFNYANAPFRFKIVEYDKATKAILLDTYGCSPFYGQPPIPNASRVQVIIVNGHAYTRWEESELIGKLKDFHPEVENQNAT